MGKNSRSTESPERAPAYKSNPIDARSDIRERWEGKGGGCQDVSSLDESADVELRRRRRKERKWLNERGELEGTLVEMRTSLVKGAESPERSC